MTRSRHTFRLIATALLLGSLAWPGPPTLHGQEARTVRGTVIDAETRRPVEGVLVRASGTEDRALTDREGGFRLDGVPAGPQTFVLQRIGYGVHEIELDPQPGEPVTIELDAVPVELPGVDAEARSFEARMDSISSFMDREALGRYWSSPETNMPRVAGLETMREYHHLDDPELALQALGVTPAMDFDCGIRSGAGIVGRFSHRNRMNFGNRGEPTIVYIDGESFGYEGQGCDQLRAMDTSSICRMELFHFPDPDLPDYRLRVWTCSFLARAAASAEPIPGLIAPVLLWPDLMGPGGG